MAEEERLGAHAESLYEERDENGELVARTVDADLFIGGIGRKQVLEHSTVGCFVDHAGQTSDSQGCSEHEHWFQ